MPGHVLSLTGGAAAYESKCALKISFSSRDATDKELARNLARTSHGISYVASTYLIPEFPRAPSLSGLLPPQLCSLFPSFRHEPMSGGLYSLRCQQNSSRIGERAAGSRGINDGILYAALVP